MLVCVGAARANSNVLILFFEQVQSNYSVSTGKTITKAVTELQVKSSTVCLVVILYLARVELNDQMGINVVRRLP
jgi:hypothetical protein